MNQSAALERARVRFRVRLAPLPAFTRNEIAAVIEAFARELEPIDIDRSTSVREVAELLRVATRTEPTVIRRDEPDEDDDKMRDLRNRIRGG